MSERTTRGTIEIWDNHWKDAPTWSFILLLAALLIITALTFLGALLLLKGSFLFAAVLSVVVGGSIYILIYKTIQFRASSDRNSNSIGIVTAGFLSIPFLLFAIFGGAALSNEFGFREAQKREFEQIEIHANTTFQTLETYILSANTLVQTELQGRCQNCSVLSSATERSDSALAVVDCFSTETAIRCAESSPPELLDELQDEINEVFIAKPEAHLAIESFLFKAQERGMRSRFYQYQIQDEARTLDSLFAELQSYQTAMLNKYSCISFPSSPVIEASPVLMLDCSDYTAVFCSGWDWGPALLIFALLASCLVPVYFADYPETLNGASDGGGMSTTI